MPESMDCGSIAYVVADNGHVSAASLAQPFATRKEAEDEAFVASGMAPERTYTVIEIERTESGSVAQTPWSSVAPAERKHGPLDALADMDPETLRALVEEAVREAAPILEANKGVFDDTVTEETMRRVVGGGGRPRAMECRFVAQARIDKVLKHIEDEMKIARPSNWNAERHYYLDPIKEMLAGEAPTTEQESTGE